MLLSELIRHLPVATVKGVADPEIEGVTHDSRSAGPGDVFVAVRGAHHDGRDYVPGLKVAAIVADAPVEADVPVVMVPDARVALAIASAALWSFPSRRVPLVGITGTNGKTTVAWMVEAIAAANGWSTGVIGTTGHRIGRSQIAAQHTTPEAPVLQRLLADMADRHIDVVAMEVSSIGLSQRRVEGTEFQVAVFTNLSRDHLDFHGSMKSYAEAKARLFRELLVPEGTAVVSGDDPYGDQMVPAGPRLWRTGLEAGNDIRATNAEMSLVGTEADLTTPAGKARLSLGLLGQHNLQNALSALGAGLAVGIPLGVCVRGLNGLKRIPGRLERVGSGEPVVLVDYAHTPDALRQVLLALRGLTPGRILTVFGCGGDRDRGKRPLMGAAASEHSNMVFLTSDNPRSEDPAAILEDIQAGVAGPCVVEVDRRAAIGLALAEAGAGDVVLIAGKGHEQTQTLGTRVIPFDDRQVASEILEEPR